MKSETPKEWFLRMLGIVGLTLNGPNPWDPHIHNEKTFARVRNQVSLGLGESYMEGWWDCDELDSFMCKILRSGVEDKIGISLPMVIGDLKSRFMNLQSVRRAFMVGKHHYNIGNDLFTRMLGSTMAYSCGYFKDTEHLDAAQIAKFELICKKLKLEKGMTVLDIGCGWGGLAKYMAENYKVNVIGLTISSEQAAYADKLCQGLPVIISLEDYRSFNKKVDRVVSVGMWEHIGFKNYRTAMEVVKKCLKEDGLFLLHTIGSLKSVTITEPWTQKYLFPNACLPSLPQLTESAEGLFVIEDVHNFGADYDKTLMAWYRNFEAAWPVLKHTKEMYDEKFYRMWSYYLKTYAGSFRSRGTELWQIVLSPKGVMGGYEAIR